MNTAQAAPATKPADMRRARPGWNAIFPAPPNSRSLLCLAGETINGIPAAWQPLEQRRRVDANIIERVFEGNDPATGLNVRVECTEYKDYPVVEWVAWFTNTGNQPTPLLQDILAMDASFSGAVASGVSLQRRLLQRRRLHAHRNVTARRRRTALRPQRRAPLRRRVSLLPPSVCRRRPLHRRRLARTVGDPFQGACRWRAGAGRAGKDTPAPAAGRKHPHAAHDRPDLDGRQRTGP